ncbi:MAG: acetylglutamate kinase [bacterium]|nr:acetylglutamate kinase [bacterium]MDT8395377.1 acetylglutamate kinase [bacterium]
MKALIEKAHVLLEALPYIRKFQGRTVVIKYGGSAMVSEGLRSRFAQDIILLRTIGIKPVIVHGGGPQIGQTLARMGKETKFVRGHRITDEETMDIVEMVLGGKVNKEIVALIQKHGGRAVGLTGKDGGLFSAEKLLIEDTPEGDGPPEIIDPGRVGKVTRVDPEVINRLDGGNFIPVIAPVGVDAEGNTYNINADSVAGAMAAALKAEKLLLMTDVPGITDGGGNLISSVDRELLGRMVRDGTIHGGMIPKVQAAVTALEGGVSKVHVVDGRVEHAVLLEIFTQTGIGTEIVP